MHCTFNTAMGRIFCCYEALEGFLKSMTIQQFICIRAIILVAISISIYNLRTNAYIRVIEECSYVWIKARQAVVTVVSRGVVSAVDTLSQHSGRIVLAVSCMSVAHALCTGQQVEEMPIKTTS